MKRAAVLAAFLILAVISAFVFIDARKTAEENLHMCVVEMQNAAAVRFLYGYSLEMDAKCRKLEDALAESVEIIEKFERLYNKCAEDRE